LQPDSGAAGSLDGQEWRPLEYSGAMENETATPPPRYAWPWWLLAAVMLGVLLAALWVSAEVRRTRERQQYQIPLSATNASAPGR
jgi:hypothetical protein